MNGYYLEVAAVVPVLSGASREELEELGSTLVKEINDNKNAIANETQRAKDAEQANTDAINAEKERAEEAEKKIAGNLEALALDVVELQTDIPNIKNQAARFDGNAFSATKNEVKLTTTGVNISKQWTVSIPAVTTEKAGVMSAEDKKVLVNLYEEAVKFNTLEVEELGDGIGINYDTFDGNSGSVEIPFATEKKAGVMSAEDKIALDTATSRAMRALFIAAGAEYNAGITDKEKTAPWGETVIHKAGHYYLNGLGDITEEQMVNIYNAGNFGVSESVQGFLENCKVRTNIPPQGTNVRRFKKFDFTYSFSSEQLEIVALTNGKNDETYPVILKSINGFLVYANKVRRVLGVMDVKLVSGWTAIYGGSLEYIKLKDMTSSIRFPESPLLSKESVVYMIENAAPVTAITIILHPDAYARLADDAEIIAALEAQPLITLVSV